MTEPVRVLNLISSPRVNAPEDFVELAAWIAEASPETAVFVLEDVARADVAANTPDLPTLTVSPGPLRALRPRRGPVLQGQHVAKSEEYRALAAVGVPVPRWVRLLPGKPVSLEGFGPYVVTKPDFGARGADVRVERRDAVKWTPPRTELGRQFGGPWNPRLAQELVYTGRWPRSYRVASLFGHAVFCFKVEADHAREPLDDRAHVSGQSIVSSSHGCTFELAFDPEVLALAKRAHTALPHVPLLGIDVLRDAETGQLFVIELNSLGWTWHFSSSTWLDSHSRFGFDLESQFNGRRLAARLLAEQCAERAR